jgi:protocatechuate 3,4-dioxygenase beta subunit
MPGSRLAVLVAIGGLAWQGAAAAQDRDQSAQAKPGRLVGRVTTGDSGRPILRAQVALIRVSETRPSAFAFTDDAGLYSFEQVAEGRYTLVVYKPGVYLETFYGRTTPDTPPKILTITAGTETRIDVILPRAGVISGRIFDETGEPLPYATVVLARPPGTTPTADQQTNTPPLIVSTVSGTSGLRVMTQPGATTNDRGEFRLFGLAPGEYMLYANPQTLQGDKRRHAPVYYPGVVDAAAAERIRILPGQEIVNVDFTLRLTPRVTVTGIALTPEGDPIRGGSLALHSTVLDGSVLNQIASIKADGSFSFESLPGHYVLRARFANLAARPEDRSGANLSLAHPLVVGTEDISGLVLRLTRGASLTGQFVFEGSTQPANTSRFSVRVQSGGPGEVVLANRKDDGTFALRGIESGTRRVSATGTAGWMLKGIYLNGRDIADQLVDFTDDTTISDVTVVFTDVMTRLHLAVQYPSSENSSIVVVFPDDSSLVNDRRIAVRAASAEPLTIEGLPKGEYLAVAISDVALGALERPDAKILERLRAVAQRFDIADAAPVSLTLRAIPLPR